MQHRAIGILALAALLALAACGGGGATSSTSPTNVRTQAGDGYVTVTWDFSGNASSFEIYRETIGTAALGAQALERIATVQDGSVREYDDVEVDSSATYAYGVAANGGAFVPAAGSGVSPKPGNDLRVLFGSAVPGGATVSITSDPPGIDCQEPGPGCEAEFAAILDVTVTADTSPGVAAIWQNCDTPSTDPCRVSMATSRTVTVDFVPANTLAVDVLPPSRGRVQSEIDLGSNPAVDCTDSCSYNYPSNLTILLSAQPQDANHYELAGWGGACSDETGSTCTVVMDASKALSAQFQLIAPEIQSFTAAPPRLTAGDGSSLSWDVTGGGDLGTGELTISIEPGIGEVASRTGSVPVTPTATTIYTLTATNDTSTVSESVTVVVGNGALIESFTASPEAINPGQSSTLAWAVSGTDTLESPLTLTLNPGGIDVTDMTSYSVEPTADTIYTLTAANEFGSDSDMAEVRVGNRPTIGSFEPLDAHITLDDSTILEWDVSGQGSVTLTLDPGGRDVTGATSAPVDPDVTTQYTLTAESEFGITTDTTTVNVGARPTIAAFDASDEFVASGETTTLSWNVEGAGTIGLVLNPGAIDVSSQDSIVLTPTTTTRYELVATSEYGRTSAEVDVTVGDAPSVEAFGANDTTVTSGSPVALTWSVSGTNDTQFPLELTLDPGGENVTGSSGTTKNPTSDTPYTLTATNAFGTDSDTLFVDVGTAPSVSNLVATPSSITSGESSILSWEIAGTTPITLSIDKDVGDVSGQTSEPVSPTSTTTYTLSAISDFGSDSESVTVTVGDAPSIASFTADDTTVTSGAAVGLSWSVSGADTLMLEPLGLDVTGKSSTTVNPESDTTYELMASNAFGSVTEPLPVDVGVAPTITSLTATPSEVTSGDPVLLEWVVTGDGPFTFSIDEGVGTVTGPSTTVYPDSSKTYTLTASSDFGSDDEPVQVTVEPSVTTVAVTGRTCDGVAVGSVYTRVCDLVQTREILDWSHT